MSVTGNNFLWKRETRVGGNQLLTQGEQDDIAQDLTIEQPEEEALTATCDFWNLARSTWNGLKEDQPIEIDIGYLDGPLETVLIGSVSSVGSPEAHGADTKYRIKAIDESEGRIRATRFNATLNEPTVGDVVRRVAAESGVGVAQCDAPGETLVDRRYPIRRRKPANKWLDRMQSEAEELDPDGRKYGWRANVGRLWFRPEEEAEDTSAVVLKKATPTQPGNIESLDPSEGKTEKSDGPPDLDFTAYLDPRIAKDGFVNVSGTDYDGVYRVTKYTIESSVTNGTHKMSGTLTEPSSEFRVLRDRSSGSGGGGGGSGVVVGGGSGAGGGTAGGGAGP